MSTQSPMADNEAGAERLGGTVIIGGDMPVHRLGFGAMRLCGPGVWGEPADAARAKGVLKRVLELGITLIDTADAYGPEVNERLIAETLHPYPEEIVIATKGGLTRPRRESWDRNGRPEHLRTACEASLRRLKVQRIDLYQLHAPDPRVPLEDSVARSLTCRPRERSATSACQTSASTNSAGRDESPGSSRCRTDTTCPTARPKAFLPNASKRASPSCPGVPWSRAATAPAHSQQSRVDTVQRPSKWR